MTITNGYCLKSNVKMLNTKYQIVNIQYLNTSCCNPQRFISSKFLDPKLLSYKINSVLSRYDRNYSF